MPCWLSFPCAFVCVLIDVLKEFERGLVGMYGIQTNNCNIECLTTDGPYSVKTPEMRIKISIFETKQYNIIFDIKPDLPVPHLCTSLVHTKADGRQSNQINQIPFGGGKPPSTPLHKTAPSHISLYPLALDLDRAHFSSS